MTIFLKISLTLIFATRRMVGPNLYLNWPRLTVIDPGWPYLMKLPTKNQRLVADKNIYNCASFIFQDCPSLQKNLFLKKNVRILEWAFFWDVARLSSFIHLKDIFSPNVELTILHSDYEKILHLRNRSNHFSPFHVVYGRRNYHESLWQRRYNWISKATDWNFMKNTIRLFKF